tara:strand:- start:30 stop:674 length:645 start_codon:yes stop_codon:yes gene_type:complete
MTRFLLVSLFLILPFKASAVEIKLGHSDVKTQIECSRPKHKHVLQRRQKIDLFINKYKPKIIKRYLNKIVLCNKLSRYGFSWIRGTYDIDKRIIFLEIDEHNDGLYVLHHEFSSILLLNLKKLDKNKWKSYNKEGYIENWRHINMNWTADNHLQEKGFLFPYSQQSLEDDFNVMSGLYLSNIFSYNQSLKDARGHYRINGKFLLLKNFYKGLLR